MSWKILQIAVGSIMFALLMGAVLVTAVLTARRPGRLHKLRILHAVSFILGWLLFLIPVLSQFYYGPLDPNYRPLDPNSQGLYRGPSEVYARFDQSLFVGFLLIFGYLLLHSFRLIFRLDKQRRAEAVTAPRDMLYLICFVVVLLSMNFASNIFTDPFYRIQTAADIQANPIWWFGFVGMLAGMLPVAIAEVSQARHDRAAAVLATRQRVERVTAAEEGE